MYSRKTKWRPLDITENEFERENYPSVERAREALLMQFKEEEAEGMVRRLSNEQAAREFPGDRLRVASLGALDKDDETFRVVHDGMHGVNVNSEARVRDQVKNPGLPTCELS